MNFYSYNPGMYTTFLDDQQYNDPFSNCNQFLDFSELQQPVDEFHRVPYQLRQQQNDAVDLTEVPEVPDIPDTCFNYISSLLSKNDSEVRPGVTLHDYTSAQVSYNGALLGEVPTLSSDDCVDGYISMINSSNNAPSTAFANVENDCVTLIDSHVNCLIEPPFGVFLSGNCDLDQLSVPHYTPLSTLSQNQVPPIDILTPQSPNNVSDTTRGMKYNEGDDTDNRSSKQSGLSNDWCEQIERYGDVLLCPEGRGNPAVLCGKSKSQSSDDQKDKKGSKKRGSKGKVVDLRTLLMRCAQCVACVDLTGAYEMLKQIREHSSPCGDFLQRVAHYLANGLEARLEGKGLELTRANENISLSEVLKANMIFVGSVPFKIMSYYTTNKTIASLASEASSIHIIDFGIYYGLQWPCIIQNLSKRPNGPPMIRVTGIDYPQRGFRPSERVDETGRCLAKYCDKYNVPFEYNGIAQQWETIKLKDLNINRNEPLVVNCLYRSHNLFDASVEDTSPRDEFLRLVRKISPDIFIHGVVNSTSNVPFFLNRFKEVMYHYSALFDVFEATMSREDDERMILESKVYGNQALNVIACEGVDRVVRPETYKQWQVRTQRAGFEQVSLDRDLVRRARAMVKRSFRDEFSYDEDGLWVVQSWKGRILYAISCWKSA